MSFSGSISGITSAFFRQSVSSNDVANLNTNGFKEGRADQVTSEAGGSEIAGVSTNQRQGPLIATGRNTDLAIEGEGFFVMGEGGERFFSRTGAMDVDAEGNVVNSVTGGTVQGRPADGAPGDIENLRVSEADRTSSAEATDEIEFSGNLNANLDVGESVNTSADVITSNGGTKTATFTFEKTDVNEFQVTSTDPATGDPGLEGTLTFDSSGNLETANIEDSPNAPGSFNGLFLTGESGSDPVKVSGGNLDFSAVVQQAGDSSVQVSNFSGQHEGRVENLSFNDGGELVASFDNGDREVIGTVAVARFNNPEGLTQEGGRLETSANSGRAEIGVAGQGGRGGIRSGFLEASNASLARELIGQIANKADLQANVKTLETKDEMLGEILDLSG